MQLLGNISSMHYIYLPSGICQKQILQTPEHCVQHYHLANKLNSLVADDLIEAEKAFDWIEWDYSLHT